MEFLQSQSHRFKTVRWHSCVVKCQMNENSSAVIPLKVLINARLLSWKRLHTPNQHISTSAFFIQSSQLPKSLSNMQISSKAKALSCFHRAKYNPLWSDAGFIRSMEETYVSVWGSVIWLCYYGVTNYWHWLREKVLTSRQKTKTNKI